MKSERRPATRGRVSRIGRLRASAAACMDEGRYRDAEPLLRQALAIAEQVRGRDHLEVATILNDLAVVFKYLGRFTEAGPLYQRALAITQKALGPQHTEVATIYHNLGGLESKVAVTDAILSGVGWPEPEQGLRPIDCRQRRGIVCPLWHNQ